MKFLSLIFISFYISNFSFSQQKIYNTAAYGAIGEGITNNAKAIQKAKDAYSAGGRKVLIPAGKTFLTGLFNFKSFVELKVETRAKLPAKPDQELLSVNFTQ